MSRAAGGEALRLDETHDPAWRSWVESANTVDTDFPVQNLPFGRFRAPGDSDWRLGVAIGDEVLDLARAGLVEHGDMHRLMALPPTQRAALRHALSQGLREGSAARLAWREALRPQSAVRMGLPCRIGDYTDFYTGIHHATTVGRLLRPEQPLLPNYKWMPIGYHGRASSIAPSPHRFPRPRGQVRAAGEGMPPQFGPTARLDHELELGLFIGAANPAGVPVGIEEAEDHLFGMVLLNDWSARDIQAWEYQPLGPFLSKSFASTVSPWVVTMEALAPFRRAFTRPPGDPAPLPYLDSAANRAHGAIDVGLEVWLQTAAMREAGHGGDCLSRSGFTDAYWTAAQLVAHHTVNGCPLATGDLLGTGTLSGPEPGQGGSLLELTQGGRQPLRLSNGEVRAFLEDGDTVILRGSCRREGWPRIGFGECRGTVGPALPQEEIPC